MKRAAMIMAAAAGASMLGGCGGGQIDDPANPPRLGNWEISRKAVNLRRNGTGVTRDDHSDVYRASGANMPDDKEECTEPRPADKEWLVGYVSRQLGRTCKINEAMQSGTGAQGRGICGEGERGDGRPNETSFTYYADAGADSFKANVEVTIRSEVFGGSGASELTALTVKVEGKRTGECGAESGGIFKEG